MKKIFAIAIALVLCASAFAQETNRDEHGLIKYGPYQTNKFWDNWFIGAGIGFNAHIDEITNLVHLDRPDLARGGAPAFQVFAGKWIEPCYGVRGDIQGWKGGYFNDGVKFKYWTANADFLVNASNLFWGYKEDRKWNFSPYASVLAIFAEGNAFGVGAGLLSTYSLSKRLDLMLDLRTGIARQSITGTGENGKIIVNTGTFGVIYKLGKTNWSRCCAGSGAAAAAASTEAASKPAKATAEEMEELQKARENALNAATAANNAAAAANNAAAAANAATAAALQEQKQNPQPAQEAAPAPAQAAPAQAAPAQAAPAQAAPAEANTPSEAVQQAIDNLKNIQFATGKPVLDERAKGNLDAVAEYLKSNPSVKVECAGHTDNTGSDAVNNPLSEKRAKVVADYLKGKGVSSDQIYVKGYGSSKPIADNNTPEGRQQNRRTELNVL